MLTMQITHNSKGSHQKATHHTSLIPRGYGSPQLLCTTVSTAHISSLSMAAVYTCGHVIISKSVVLMPATNLSMSCQSKSSLQQLLLFLHLQYYAPFHQWNPALCLQFLPRLYHGRPLWPCVSSIWYYHTTQYTKGFYACNTDPRTSTFYVSLEAAHVPEWGN